MTAQQPKTKRAKGRRLAWLAVAMGIVRSRRFQDRVIVDAIGLAALGRIGRETRNHAFVRVRTWARKVDQRAQRMMTAPKR